MPDDATAREAQAEVSALRARAIDHKQESQRHRRAAQKIMQEMEEKIKWCQSHGIAVEIDIPRAGGLKVHGRHHDSP